MGPPPPGPRRPRRHPHVGGRHGLRGPAGRRRGPEAPGRARRLRLPGDPPVVFRGRGGLAAAAARLVRRNGLAVHDAGPGAGLELYRQGLHETGRSGHRPAAGLSSLLLRHREQRPPRGPQSAPVRRPALHDGLRRPQDEDRRRRPDAHSLLPPQPGRPGLGRVRSSRSSAASPSNATSSSFPTRSTTTSSTAATATRSSPRSRRSWPSRRSPASRRARPSTSPG